MPAHRIYLDNAATSWPKPQPVYAAIERYLRENGAPAGRSAYHEATESGRALDDARRAVARLLGAADPNRIVFTANGTDALNLAIHGLLRPGDHAVCTDADHNSVLRPLRHWEENGGVEVTRVQCSETGLVDAEEVRRALRPNTRLVVMLHASNVTGVIQPIADVGRICRDAGVHFLVDAAQSLGHVSLSVEELSADLLAAPGHKGMLGPLGTGVLYLRPGMETELRAVRQGGTGTESENDRQPETLPEKYEAGNLNVAGIVGLAAALQWMESRGVAAIRDHEQQLTVRLRDGMKRVPGVAVYGPSTTADSVGVVSVNLEGYDPQEAAAALDSAFRVQVRSGLHCAPRLHRALGTLERGGTVRFSIGAFNTADDIDSAVRAVEEII